MARSSAMDLTTGTPRRQIFLFSVPLILGTLFQQLYSFVDTVMALRNTLQGVRLLDQHCVPGLYRNLPVQSDGLGVRTRILRRHAAQQAERDTGRNQRTLTKSLPLLPETAGFLKLYKKSVVDLLDIADVCIVQHITAMRQNAGECTNDVQHDHYSFR